MIERLLVPVVGDALDTRAFDTSIALAKQLGAAITGFIVEPFARANGPGAPAVASADSQLHGHAEGVLGRFERSAQMAGVPFRGVATQASRIGQAIVAAAQEQRCDMIVMSTHGRGPIGELMWGSHTRDVISLTELPVLVLR